MGIGFKYHVVTIAAIFFALTVGLVIGSLYVSPRVPQQQAIAIQALRGALDKNNADLKLQQQERDGLQACLKQALPYALDGRLRNKRIALVQSGGDDNGLASLRETLRQAGAQVVSVTMLERPFMQPDEVLLPRLQSLQAGDPRIPTDRGGLMKTLAGVFAHGESGVSLVMPALQNAGLVRYDTDSLYTLSAQSVVLLTGSRNESSNLAANVDQPLVQALQQETIPVFACEQEDVTTSSFPAFRAANMAVTTIDRVDTDPGRWNLISALASDKEP